MYKKKSTNPQSLQRAVVSDFLKTHSPQKSRNMQQFFIVLRIEKAIFFRHFRVEYAWNKIMPSAIQMPRAFRTKHYFATVNENCPLTAIQMPSAFETKYNTERPQNAKLLRTYNCHLRPKIILERFIQRWVSCACNAKFYLLVIEYLFKHLPAHINIPVNLAAIFQHFKNTLQRD